MDGTRCMCFPFREGGGLPHNNTERVSIGYPDRDEIFKTKPHMDAYWCLKKCNFNPRWGNFSAKQKQLHCNKSN